MLQKEATKLEGLLAQSAAGLDDGATNSGSRDAAAVSRAGPCAGYQDLKIIQEVKNMACDFRSCSSKDQLKQVAEDLTTPKKLLQTLMGSCRKALSELRGAKARADAAVEAAKKKQVKAEANAKKEAKGAKGGGRGSKVKAGACDHAIFQLSPEDFAAIPASSSWESSCLLEKPKPFLISNVKALTATNETESVLAKALKEFAKAFNESALKAWPGGLAATLNPKP